MLYPQDFDSGELRDLDKDLRLYIADVHSDVSFSNIETITKLSKKMVETRRHLIYPLFYRLLKLVTVFLHLQLGLYSTLILWLILLLVRRRIMCPA
jgi:hypothetical protein